MIRFQKILVPTDFSPAAKQALPYASELAKLHDAEILLVHVMELPHYPTLFEGTALVVPPIDDSLRAQLTEQLQKAAHEVTETSGVRCRTVLREGPPTPELLDCAKEEGADLIVIATHGYTGLKHMLLGSTAEQVVRHACCPVLTIRADLAADRQNRP
jgi:nucleotide-binding universal stress UspA family protein